MNMIAVAIDGPVGAGKSTIARAAAKQLGYIYVDTGALYRALGLFALENDANPSELADVEPLLKRARLELKHVDGLQRVILNGRDVSEEIRAPEISMAASSISALPQVRAFLLDLQRDMAKTHNVVMDGRDIGTVILPRAQVKIFLTASAESRAKRRFEEYLAKGDNVRYNDVLEDLIKRDKNDASREAAPLRQAEDAILLDTTGNELEASIRQVISIINGQLTINNDQ
jgi:cytidylate kinase